MIHPWKSLVRGSYLRPRSVADTRFKTDVWQWHNGFGSGIRSPSSPPPRSPQRSAGVIVLVVIHGGVCREQTSLRMRSRSRKWIVARAFIAAPLQPPRSDTRPPENHPAIFSSRRFRGASDGTEALGSDPSLDSSNPSEKAIYNMPMMHMLHRFATFWSHTTPRYLCCQ